MNNRRFGTIVAITSLLLLFLIIPYVNHSINERPNAQSTRSLTIQQDDNRGSTSHILNVNSIKLYESTQHKLDSKDSLTSIPHPTGEKSHYKNKEVIVDFKTLPSSNLLEKVEKDINGKVLEKLESHISFTSKTLSTEELIVYFTKREDVEYAEPHYIYMQNEQHNSLNTAQPNDFYYNRYQWNLPMIRTENGWNITRGVEDIEIAVLDTGIDLKHPDLIERLTTGYNVIADNDQPEDDNGHGTHVSGVIASETNNEEGVAGITWFNPVMPIKVMGNEGFGSTLDIAKGIVWATNHGADVINMSLGNYKDSDLLHEAVRYAYDNDVVIIAATGNDNTKQPSFPAAYPEVLSVAAVDYNGNRASFSNYGAHVDVSAPGVDIPSTYIGQQYAALSGTSMATPHVAALCGLIRSVNNDLTNDEVMEIIKSTSYDLGEPGPDIYFGTGLIDIPDALNAASK